jgi:transposase InsO family protein
LELVGELRGAFGVEPLLRELNIPKNTYDRWVYRAQHPSAREVRDGELLAAIRRIHDESGGVYGSPRVHAQLQRQGEAVSRTRVERLMREAGITGVAPARKMRTTIPNPADARPHDLVSRAFTAEGPDRLWVTDLTVIPTGEGPLWLASIRDAFSRKVVAWESADTADADLVCAVLEYALRSRRPAADGSLIHHADHGSQYTSIKLTTRLIRSGIRASMGTVGDSFDNALAENLWSAIKTECVRRHTFATHAEANQAIFEYLDGFYNPRRIQKGLGWRSPDEFEAAHHAGELTEQDYTRLAELAQRRRARRATTRDAVSTQHAEEHKSPDTVAGARRSAEGQHQSPARHPATRSAPPTGTAERVRPSGRTLTRTKESRSTG